MSDVPVFRLGRVVQRGEELVFEPAAEGVFDARAGERVELAVLYDYAERLAEKERFTVRLSVAVEGKEIGAAEAAVGDRPGLTDAERGALVVATWFSAQGLVSGRFTVEADYAVGDWSGGRKGGSALSAAGRFLVRVH